MKLLFVIDMQNDFIDGVLGSSEAQAIVPKVVEKIKNEDKYTIITATFDTHWSSTYLETEEGKHLPIPHCLYQTKGWELNKDVEKALIGKNHIKQYKYSFGYPWESKEYLDYITEIEIIGLDTDFCILANAMTLKAAYPNVSITIDASCCAGSSPEWHEKALDILEHCHFNVINR